jgi:hypothetical protein
MESQAHGLVIIPVDEDEGSSPQGGVNWQQRRENRKISGSPPGAPLPNYFPSKIKSGEQACRSNPADKDPGMALFRSSNEKLYRERTAPLKAFGVIKSAEN